MSLRDMLGYNTDKITVWEATEGEKDIDGIPKRYGKRLSLMGNGKML